MNNRLEQFIRDHREEFDSEEPSKKIWDKIQFPADHVKQEAPVPIVWMSTRRWAAVAAVSLLMAGSVWYFSRTTTPAAGSNGQEQQIAKRTENTATPTDTGSAAPAKGAQPTDSPASPGVREKAPLVAAATPKQAPTEPNFESDYQEEMVHYARLVELKHKELKIIEKDEPLLYRQFAGDVRKLDSVYHNLEKQLPENPNREQLLEAMLQNLQLQMGLLNHQLDIIKQINHSKQKMYEKAYKTI